MDETSFLAADACHPTLLVSGLADLDRHRLIDVVPGRSARRWRVAAGQAARWLAGVATAVIDPYSGYALGLGRGAPRSPPRVVDHFHAVRLANQALDEVRRRVQHETLGHRGRKADPSTEGRLAAHERLDEGAWSRVVVLLEVGDPAGEAGVTYMAKELLRDVYGTGTAASSVSSLVLVFGRADHRASQGSAPPTAVPRYLRGRRGAPERTPLYPARSPLSGSPRGGGQGRR